MRAWLLIAPPRALAPISREFPVEILTKVRVLKVANAMRSMGCNPTDERLQPYASGLQPYMPTL